jgi:hypothetical protein
VQAWWGSWGQQVYEGGETQKGRLAEEDGAVDALVCSVPAQPGEPLEKSAESARGWLRRLGQLQNIAASAASSVGGVANMMPTSIHFGRALTWPAVSYSPTLLMNSFQRCGLHGGVRATFGPFIAGSLLYSLC